MRILMIEDDRELCEAVKLQLSHAGFQVDLCHDGEEALLYIPDRPYDVIILDRMLPHIDGISVLQAIRRRRLATPVIITTALGQLGDKVAGLDAGADDYLVKPFDIEELLARIRAVTRRPRQLADSGQADFSDLSLNPSVHELRCKGSLLVLSKKESELLEYMIRNSGRTLSRAALLSYVWGPGAEVEDGNLDNYIYFLRRRLKSVKSSVAIRTIHGVGYRLEQAAGDQCKEERKI